MHFLHLGRGWGNTWYGCSCGVSRMGIWRGGDCEIRGDICEVQACNYCSRKFFRQRKMPRRWGEGEGEGEGRAACQLVSRIDMWDFGSLQMASACERGSIRCARIEIDFRRGLEERRRAKRGRITSQKSFRRFIPACDSYLAEAVQRWKKPDMAVGELAEEGRRGQRQDVAVPACNCCTESSKTIGVANSQNPNCTPELRTV
jgi:hypothetical protein